MFKNTGKNLLTILIIMSFLFSCETESSLDSISENNSESQVTFGSIQKNVFKNRCAFSGCHATDTRSAGLDLSSSKAYDNLVNVPAVLSAQGLKRVEPFNSGASFLIKVLDGSNPTKMPLNRPPLDETTIEIIKQWIDEGAKNN